MSSESEFIRRTNKEKPPLGVIPKQLWLEKRYGDLDRAARDYIGDQRFDDAIRFIREMEWVSKLINP